MRALAGPGGSPSPHIQPALSCGSARRIAEFISAVRDIQAGRRTPEDFDGELATVGAIVHAEGPSGEGRGTAVTRGGTPTTAASTFMTTAILEAGRMSLDSGGRAVRIVYEDEQALRPTGVELL